LHELLGDGIFNADGQNWFAQRKTASQMFTAKLFKDHIWKVVERNSGTVLELLRRNIDGDSVDVFNLMNRFTLDTIGEIGFGTSVGSLDNPDSPFLRSFDEGQRILFKRFLFPGWQLLRLLRIGFEKDGRHHFTVLREYSAQIVQGLRTKLDTQAGNSFVGLFMKSNKTGFPNSGEFLADMVLNFLIAGRDTTAQAMSWCLFLVMQHPEVESKILEEVASVSNDGPLSYDHLRELKYLEATLNESLRLYPSVPLDGKFVGRGDTLPDGTYLPKGCQIFYTTYSMGRSERIWGKDAAEFRPERWLEMQEPMSPYSNPVFHAGPRECLGKRLAMVEMKTVVASVLRSVKLELAVRVEDVLQDTQLTIGMSRGLKCRVLKR